jgi:hypothetical protein
LYLLLKKVRINIEVEAGRRKNLNIAFDPLGWDALKTGASITTLIGLLGFVVSCIFLAYFVRTRAETKNLELLPPKKRIESLEPYLKRYKLTLEKLPVDKKYELVIREMRNSIIWQFFVFGSSLLVFIVCFAIIALKPSDHSDIKRPRARTAADETVIGYQRDIQALRADFEAGNTWENVRREGVRLADLIGGVSEENLNPSRQIIKNEYQGWALLMVARTYVGSEPRQRSQRVYYAEQSITAFDRALYRMEIVKNKYSAGDSDAAEDFNWMMSESEDLNRTLYLRATALAVSAEAGGRHTKDEVHAELAKITPAYLEKYPTSRNPDLTWAQKYAGNPR